MSEQHPLPDVALRGHIAVVGMTGGGKTFTTKGIVEHILERNPKARVCILDPIKSDWWGITSSADGKRPGLPFHILGGPRGHVPLHESTGKAIGEIVGTGALPLSIIDMADFGPGGLQAFFNDFAPALLRRMRGVVHLVLEEAHEFAPKERAGFGGETMTVHFAKKLATAGRSQGIRIIAATQRTQALHNALLGSCQTVIAHQLAYPADIDPISKWFKGHASKENYAAFMDDLTSLPTGTGWLCCGQAKITQRVQFPRIWTFDNSATPDGSTADIDITTAPVDRDKLRNLMGAALEEARANDPAELQEEIKRLRAELAAKPPAPGRTAPDPAALDAAQQAGYRDGYRTGRMHAYGTATADIDEVEATLAKLRNRWREAMDRSDLPAGLGGPTPPPRETQPAVARALVRDTTRAMEAAAVPSPRTAVAAMPTSTAHATGLTRPQQRILDALAWLESIGVTIAPRPRLAWLADSTATSSSFMNNLGALRTAGLIAYPGGGDVQLTGPGRELANPAARPRTDAELHASIRAKVTNPQWAILEQCIAAYPRVLSREELATRAGSTETSSSFMNNLGSLRSIGLIGYPEKGQVVATAALFVE